MATTPAQQTWVPFGSTKDCSMGFCSIYCPQWCYVVFPPPPPIEFDDEGSGRTLSPIVIAVIGILASAFLLLSYYAIVSRYCGAFDSLRNRLHGPAGEHGRRHHGRSRDEEELWETPPPDGIEEALINKITVYKYRRSDGFVDGNDCSVCLSEFREDDSLRLLPRCSHAFHVQCIDTWLKSHSNCPLCRANIHWPTWTPPPAAQLPPLQEANRAPASREGRRQDEIVVIIDDLVIGGEEGDHHQPPNSGGAPKDDVQNRRGSGGPEGRNAVVDMKEDAAEPARRSSPLDDSARGRVPMADVLRSSAVEGELMAAGAADGPSEREHGMGKDSSRSRGLHSAMTDPEPAKRSPSSTGMFCLTRNGKGRSSSNPPA